MYHGVAWGFGRLNHLVTNDFEYSSRGMIEISPLQLAHSLSPARACSGCPPSPGATAPRLGVTGCFSLNQRRVFSVHVFIVSFHILEIEMNRKPGVKVLFNITCLLSNLVMRTVLKFHVCLNPLVYPKTRDFDLRQGRAMARRKSGEAPWFSDNFCWPFWNWSWNWQGRIPADEAWPEWYEFRLPTPVLVQGFSTRRTVQFYLFRYN